MYKKLLVSSFICASLLTSSVGCAKKGPSKNEVDSSSRASTETSGVTIASDVNKSEANTLISKLKASLPQIAVTKVDNSPLNGMYQVTAGDNILYVTKNGQYMLAGDLINVSTKMNMTEEFRKSSRLSVIKDISESNMVVFTPKGKVEHTITVFTDVDCGYCRKFHQEIQSYLDKGIKVRYMSFPRAGKGSDSYNKAATIWCSKDRNEAMNKAKLTETFKADTTLCDSKKVVDESLDIVQKLGLNGTPALILDDGTLLPGYMPADKLKTALDMNAQRNKEALSSSKGASAGSSQNNS